MPVSREFRGWELPDRLERELRDYVSEVTGPVASHGRIENFCSYIRALLRRTPGQSYAAAFGGSRSTEYDVARKLLTRSTWPPAPLAMQTLLRLQRLIEEGVLARPAIAVDAVGLRRSIDDDEPRFNYLLMSVVFRDATWSIRREFPLHGMLLGPDEYPDTRSMQEGIWHLLGHLPAELTQRRLLSFGALQTWARAMLHARGWQYLQQIPDPDRLPYRLRFHGVDRPPTPLRDLEKYVVREYMQRGQYVLFSGELAVNDEVPDWEELVVACRPSMTEPVEIMWNVTNGEPDDRTMDLVEIGTSQSYLPGHLDVLGGGLYRGPTHRALLRHLALVDIGIGFVSERAARGCLWGLRREHVAGQRFMTHFLRERAALSIEISPQEQAQAMRLLRPLDP